MWLTHHESGCQLQTWCRERSWDTSSKGCTKHSVRGLYACGVCYGTYQEETVEVEDWIGCDRCDAWFHWVCVNITEEPSIFFMCQLSSLVFVFGSLLFMCISLVISIDKVQCILNHNTILCMPYAVPLSWWHRWFCMKRKKNKKTVPTCACGVYVGIYPCDLPQGWGILLTLQANPPPLPTMCPQGGRWGNTLIGA